MHGTKDYGNVAPKETTYQLTDMAELAVRLGALSSLDRLGDVILLEDFSNGIYNWQQELYGTGAAISLDTTHFKGSGFAAKMVGGSTSVGLAVMRMDFPYPVLSNFGLECCMTIGDDVGEIWFYFYIVSAEYYYIGNIKIDPVNNRISYLDTNYETVVLTSDLKLYIGDYGYNNFKMVFDLINKKYKRFCYNNDVASMSGLDLYYGIWPSTEYIAIHFYVFSKPGLNGVCYLDNVIVTQNEP